MWAVAHLEFDPTHKLICCLNLASKMDELDDNLTTTSKITWSMYNSKYIHNLYHCSSDMLVSIEKWILTELNFECHIHTVFDYVEMLLSLGVIFTDDEIQTPIANEKTRGPVGWWECKNLNKLVWTLSRVCLVQMMGSSHQVSVWAATCVHLAWKLFGLKQVWNPVLTKITGYTEDDLESSEASLIEFIVSFSTTYSRYTP